MNKKLTVNKRLLQDVLALYPSAFRAFCELINNALQARAKNIWIDLKKVSEQALTETGSPFESIGIRDDGVGVSKSDFPFKVLQIATPAKEESGGRGVGRFAALQLGKTMQIETIAFDQIEQRYSCTQTTIDTTKWEDASELGGVEIDVQEEDLGEGQRETGYVVTVTNFFPLEKREGDTEKDGKTKKRHQLHPVFTENQRLRLLLFSRYADVVVRRTTTLHINGEVIDPSEFVVGVPEESKQDFRTETGERYWLSYQFMRVRGVEGGHRVFLRTTSDASCTMARTFDYHVDLPEEHVWFVMVESQYFDQNLDLFESFGLEEGMDSRVEHLQKELKKHVDAFFQKKYSEYFDFLKRLKADVHYPYRKLKPSSEVRASVFNHLAYFVEKKHPLLRRGESIRQMVYGLIDKALNEEDLQPLLEDVLQMDCKVMEHYRKLRERTRLENVLVFSERVAKKNQVLDFLWTILYAEEAKYVKERKQLHKMVERHLWLFGEEYKDTPLLFSDKSLLTNLVALREAVFKYEPDEKDDNSRQVEEPVKSITDLFFFNERPIAGNRREVMVVELKAPRVKISQKEISQAEKYAYEIMTRGCFSRSLSYRVILVSSELAPIAKSKLGMIDLDRPNLIVRQKQKDIEVWLYEWSDLIAQCRQKLTYLGENLEVEERDVRTAWDEEFSDIPLGRLESRLIDKLAPKSKRKRSKTKPEKIT